MKLNYPKLAKMPKLTKTSLNLFKPTSKNSSATIKAPVMINPNLAYN